MKNDEEEITGDIDRLTETGKVWLLLISTLKWTYTQHNFHSHKTTKNIKNQILLILLRLLPFFMHAIIIIICIYISQQQEKYFS